MNTEKPLVAKEYLLEKMQGKGGWTYAKIPEILQNKHAPFGWVKVRGTIDHFEIKNYHLMPMGNGMLFLPIKAAIRKQIKKQAGDYVFITLFADNQPTEIPEELKLCLQEYDPQILERFLKYTNGEQKAFIEWIYSAKGEQTKTQRILNTIEKIKKGQKFTTPTHND